MVKPIQSIGGLWLAHEGLLQVTMAPAAALHLAASPSRQKEVDDLVLDFFLGQVSKASSADPALETGSTSGTSSSSLYLAPELVQFRFPNLEIPSARRCY